MDALQNSADAKPCNYSASAPRAPPAQKDGLAGGECFLSCARSLARRRSAPIRRGQDEAFFGDDSRAGGWVGRSGSVWEKHADKPQTVPQRPAYDGGGLHAKVGTGLDRENEYGQQISTYVYRVYLQLRLSAPYYPGPEVIAVLRGSSEPCPESPHAIRPNSLTVVLTGGDQSLFQRSVRLLNLLRNLIRLFALNLQLNYSCAFVAFAIGPTLRQLVFMNCGVADFS